MSDSSKPKARRGATGGGRPELFRGERIRDKDFEPMQGASRQSVNAEEMLAELKRLVESSTPPPSFRPPNASMLSKSGSLARRVQTEEESDRRIQATADNSVESGQPTVPRKAAKPIARSWKLAGGLSLAGTTMIGATVALMNRAPDLPKRELAVVAKEGPVRPQGGGQTIEPGPLMQDSRPTEPSQVGDLETRPDAMTTPARSSAPPAGGEAGADAPPQPRPYGLLGHFAQIGVAAEIFFAQGPANGLNPMGSYPCTRVGGNNWADANWRIIEIRTAEGGCCSNG